MSTRNILRLPCTISCIFRPTRVAFSRIARNYSVPNLIQQFVQKVDANSEDSIVHFRSLHSQLTLANTQEEIRTIPPESLEGFIRLCAARGELSLVRDAYKFMKECDMRIASDTYSFVFTALATKSRLFYQDAISVFLDMQSNKNKGNSGATAPTLEEYRLAFQTCGKIHDSSNAWIIYNHATRVKTEFDITTYNAMLAALADSKDSRAITLFENMKAMGMVDLQSYKNVIWVCVRTRYFEKGIAYFHEVNKSGLLDSTFDTGAIYEQLLLISLHKHSIDACMQVFSMMKANQSACSRKVIERFMSILTRLALRALHNEHVVSTSIPLDQLPSHVFSVFEELKAMFGSGAKHSNPAQVVENMLFVYESVIRYACSLGDVDRALQYVNELKQSVDSLGQLPKHGPLAHAHSVVMYEMIKVVNTAKAMDPNLLSATS